MKKLKFFVSLFALLSISIAANATTIHYDLGPTSPDHFLYDYAFASGDIIDDIYLFDIDPSTMPSILSTTATSFGIDNFSYTLTDLIPMSMPTWGTAGDVVEFAHLVSGGQFGVHFQGTVTGTMGIISGITAIAPVPVPAAAWLFGSAFLGLLGMSRSRKVTV